MFCVYFYCFKKIFHISPDVGLTTISSITVRELMIKAFQTIRAISSDGIKRSSGKSTPSLNEMVTVCGIPGKMDMDGQQVAPLWLKGKLGKIIAYNEFDVLTTYLLWLRLAYFGGFFSDVLFV